MRLVLRGHDIFRLHYERTQPCCICSSEVSIILVHFIDSIFSFSYEIAAAWRYSVLCGDVYG